MFATLLKKELITSIITVRFIVAVFICCLLMPLSVWVLSSDYLRDAEDYQARVGMEERRSEGKQLATTANRPIPPLSPLFRGVSPESANSVNLRFYIGWNVPAAAATQSITHDIFPTVDLTFIIGIILSALALMFSFDAVSGEKADATLRAMMSYSLSRSRVILGKWLGLSIALLIPFILGIVISLGIFLGTTGIVLNGSEWMALVLALFTAAVYVSLFVLIGLLISALTHNPSVSIFACLGVWGLLTIVLPQVATAGAGIAEPIHTPQTIERNLRENYNEFAASIRKANMDLVERAKREGLKYREFQDKRNENELLASIDHKYEINQIERQYWLEVERQERASRIASLFSPYGCFSQAVISLADTGPAGQRTFMTQAYDFGEKHFEYLWETRLSGDSSWEEIYNNAPTFDYKPIPIEERIGAASMPLGVLVVIHLVILFAAVIAFNRYDVR